MTDSIRQALLKRGLGYGYVLWLILKSTTRQAGISTTTGATDFHQWLNLQPHNTIRFWLLAPQVIGCCLGASAMVGALSYSGSAPVNLWIILLLFAVVPLLLSAVGIAKLAAGLIHQRQRNQHWTPSLLPHGLRAFFCQHLPINATAINNQTGHHWLLYRLQLMGIAFQASAMASFMAILLVKDVAFGWSSTLVTNAASVTTVFYYLSLPWQSVIGAPSLELVTQSQFFYHDGAIATTSKPWWPHLLFALFFYGLVPRIILCHWLKVITTKLFKAELLHSDAIAQFYALQPQPTTLAAKMPAAQQTQQPLNISPSIGIDHMGNILNWQQENHEGAMHVLGKDRWLDDENWLKQCSFKEGDIFIVVSDEQTPTAELSDLLTLMPNRVQLVVIVKREPDNVSALRSWQYFANDIALPIQLTRRITQQGAPL